MLYVVDNELEDEEADEEVDEVALEPLVDGEGLSVGLSAFGGLLPGNMFGAGNKLLVTTLYQHPSRTMVQKRQNSRR